MPLDPQIAGLLQFIADAGYPPMHEGDPETARKGFRALTVDMVSPDQVIAVAEVRDARRTGWGRAAPGAALPARG